MGNPLAQITFEFKPAGIPISMETNPVTPQEVLNENPVLETIENISPQREAEQKNPLPGKRGRKALKEASENADMIQVPADDVLYQKQYYSIGEVATMFRENQSLIRYWETEFDILQPRKNRKGDRFFRPVDIRNLELIYDLLRRRKFTIEGARDYLKNDKKAEEKFALIRSLEQIKAFLLELKTTL